MLTTKPPKILYTVEQIRELDRLAIEAYHIAGFTLMNRAAQAAYRVVKSQWPQARTLVVVCGVGNNGGDGYLLACLAQADGMKVTLVQAGSPRAGGDAARACEQWLAGGGDTLSLSERMDVLRSADIIVDALLGSGLQRNVSDAWLELIMDINKMSIPVLSMDIPSGLNADTGAVMGVAVQASMTVTFIGQKAGLYTGRGPDYVGKVYFDDLDVPDELYTRVPSAQHVLDKHILGSLLPTRKPVCHKGQFGHVLVIGGDIGMAGAVRMAAEAAARVGAGLVSVATHTRHAVQVGMSRPELMCHGIEHARELLPLLDKASVVIIGPGLGQTDWARDILTTVLATQLSLVVDADALNLLARQPLKRGRWILTPHAGEASRLLGCSSQQVQDDRFSSVKDISEKYNCVAVLKGAGTLIHTVHEKFVHLCRDGNAGMATAGMGDVLSGIIAGLLAQGLSFTDAARCGVLVHALAADQVAQQGQRGMLATDLFPYLRRWVNADISAEGSP